jgi:hypothetical protein
MLCRNDTGDKKSLAFPNDGFPTTYEWLVLSMCVRVSELSESERERENERGGEREDRKCFFCVRVGGICEGQEVSLVL